MSCFRTKFHAKYVLWLHSPLSYGLADQIGRRASQRLGDH
jgi:hypothetical protein